MIKNGTSNELIELLLVSLFFFLGFLVTTYLAKIKGFFSLPFRKYAGAICGGIDVLFNIFFYIFSLFLSSILLTRFYSARALSPIYLVALIQSLSLLINIILITLYSYIGNGFFPKMIIKDLAFPGKGSIAYDILSGLKALLLALLPLFTMMCLFESILIYSGIETPPLQEAVKFLIQALKNGPAVYPALFAIIVAAPIIEEFLFRGVIQTYFRKKLGTTSAIFFASILFSLFHFSWAQGMQNVFILLSLFILSLYLGFIYEKTRSLIASITLHVTFNLINTIVIIIYNS